MTCDTGGGGDNRPFQSGEREEAHERFLERVIDRTVEGMRVDGRPVEPFDSWLARHRWRQLPAWLAMLAIAWARRMR